MLRIKGGFIILCLLYFHGSYAQSSDLKSQFYSSWSNPNSAFFEVDSLASLHFVGSTLHDSIELKNHKFYLRWKAFAENRLDSSKTLRTFHQVLYGPQTLSTCSSFDQTIWNVVGPNSGLENNHGVGRLTCFEPDHSDTSGSSYFVGSSYGGLFYSNNDGYSFNNLTDINELPAFGILDIDVPDDDPDEIWITTSTGSAVPHSNWPDYSAGLWKSEDKGNTWARIADTVFDWASEMKVLMSHPQAPQLHYVTRNNELWVTKDDGATFTKAVKLKPTYKVINSALLDYDSLTPSHHWCYLSAFPELLNDTNPALFKYEVFSNGSDTLYEITPDSVPSWHQLSNIEQIEIAVNNLGQLYLWLPPSNSSEESILMKSRDGGQSWPSSSTNFLQVAADYNVRSRSAFSVSPTDTSVLYLGGVYATRVSNFPGMNIYEESIVEGHVDIHDFYARPTGTSGTLDKLYLINDGGLYSHDGGIIWVEARNGLGLNITEFYHGDASNNAKGRYIGGAQDVSTLFKPDDNSVWKKIGLGDGGNVEFTPDDRYVFFTMSPGGPGYIRRVRTGLTYNSSSSLAQFNFNTTTTFRFNESFDKLIYNQVNSLGESNLFEINGATSSSPSSSNTLQNTVGIGKVSSIKQSAINDSIIFYCHYRPIGDLDTISDLIFKYNIISHQRTDLSNYPWTNLGIGGPKQGRQVSDVVAVVNQNGDEDLYITLGGYNPDNSSNYIHKVWKFNGIEWTEFGQGIEGFEFPVHSIDIQYAEPYNVLYIGTDNGVWFRVLDGSSEWYCYGEKLPRTRVSKVEVNHCNNKLIAYTLGRGIYNVDLYYETLQFPNRHVYSSYSVNDKLTSGANFVVHDGAIMTVEDTLVMPQNSSITVKAGGELKVDGGVITTGECGGFWHGIIAEGKGHSGQSPYSQLLPQYHGKVKIINGATIMKARIGVALGVPESDNKGGILDARNSTFLNNWIDVSFLPYLNTLPTNSNVVLNNKSIISDCRFQTTDSVLSDSIAEPFAHIRLEDVKGVAILGCTIEDNVSYSNSYRSRDADKRIGVLSFNSVFTVDSKCPSQQPFQFMNGCWTSSLADSTKFYGLNVGIRAENSNSIVPVTIRGAEFKKSLRPLVLIGTEFAEVYKNKLVQNVSPNDYSPFIDYPGIQVEGSSGYFIESNSITGEGNRNGGLLVVSSGGDSNEVRKNVLDGLRVGAQFSKNNDGSGLYDGVIHRCNENNGNTFDITVRKGNIGMYQGVCGMVSHPANNSFDTSCVGSQQLHLSQVTQQTTYSYYNHNSLIPDCYSAQTQLQSCGNLPDEYCVENSKVSPSALKLKIYELAYEIDSTRNRWDSVDNSLNNRILDDEENSSLFSSMLAEAPMLSDKVLINLLDNKATPFSDSLIIELLKGCLPLTSIVDSVLLDKSPNVVDSLIPYSDSNDFYSERTRKRLLLSYKDRELKTTEEEYLRYYLVYDTAGFGFDSVITFLELKPSFRNELLKAKTQLFYNRFNDLESTLTNLLQEDLSQTQLDELNLLQTLKKLKAGSSDFVDTEQDSLFSSVLGYADTLNNTRLGYNARALLAKETNQFQDLEQLYIPSTLLSKKGAKDEFIDSDKHTLVSPFSIYPNPTNYSLTIETLSADLLNKEANFDVVNIQGQVVLRSSIDLSSKMEIYLGGIASGAYYLRIDVKDSSVFLERFIKL